MLWLLLTVFIALSERSFKRGKALSLFSEVSKLIAAAKERVAVSVNAELTMLYWSAGKNEEHVELLELGRSNIRVASYMTELPPKKVLEAKLRLAIEAARNRLAAKGGES